MEPKYKFTDEEKVVIGSDGTKHTVRRIMALRDIPRHGVKAGDLGGWIEKEENLSQNGADSWVADDAIVFDKAKVIAVPDAHGGGKVMQFTAQEKKAVKNADFTGTTASAFIR